ncbi:MAG: peptidyl-prolyl cis-trans isomerase [Magnetococcales bacterium]|nr:peptidyl-prolyl cis-trans isomerase [Magnetococcales bacterium]
MPVMVVLTTSLGDIVIALDTKKAPITVQNFLNYVDSGFYDGLIFHRVIPNFVIQGGGLTQDMLGKTPNTPIKNEADNGLSNKRGTLAMARTSAVDSATSQFFINLVDNTFLDHTTQSFGYAVFGLVTVGMEIVDKIAAVKTATYKGFADVPIEPVILLKARRL